MGLWLYLLLYAAGLANAPYFQASGLWPALALLSAALYMPRRRTNLALPLLLLFFWSLGITFYHLELTPPTESGHIRAFVADTPIRVEGTVLSVAHRYEGGAIIDLRTDRVIGDRLITPVHGRLRLYIDQGEGTPEIGNRVCFRSRLRAPRSYGTPGEFDYPRHLAFQDLFVTAFLDNTRDLAVFARTDTHGKMSIEAFRTFVGKRIDKAVAPPLAPLVRALVIGDKSGLSPEHEQVLAQGGISHLFAISGLHIGLVAAMLLVVARLLYQRSERLTLFAPALRLLPVLLLPVLLAYLLLTGNAISTRRAFVMLLVATTLLLGSRQTPPLKLLATCAFVFLLSEPLMLFQPAFQLSFAGLFGILVLVPRWLERLPQRPGPLRYLATLALTTLAASLATAPLVLLNFHLMAPAGLITNLFAVPAVGFAAVPLGLVGALIAPAWAQGGDWLFQGGAVVIQYTLTAVEQLLRFPALASHLAYCSQATVMASFFLSGILLLPGGSKRRWQLRALFGLTAALLLWAPLRPAPALAATALSVGQGDSTLLSFGGRHHYLVDGGGNYSTHFDTGERLVAPALGWLGVRSLDAVILTHDHPDHRKGLQYVLQHFTVGEFWTPIPQDRLDPQLRQILVEKKIPLVCPAPGWSKADSPTTNALWIFIPDQNDANLNNRSLVLLASCGKDAVLLPADLEEKGIEQLLAEGFPQAVNLLKFPHHGSRKSHPELLLNRIAPQYVFASLGAKNPHGFPHLEVISMLRARNLPLWRTDLHGSLQFNTDGQGWQATHWNQRLFR
ncbi:MAG: DNA internalization-related competence protein ComEC/Rec2 [Desulfuromonadaceae bacterium GWC2_58_13]|nr:MAG: DNA internalization-related competence protein ComEC/Rec2 [Desulfuromonadaceae bacterium GWC2_58_13]